MAGETIKIELTELKNSIAGEIKAEIANAFKETYLNEVYPVGSVYITVVNENPSKFLFGQWERIAKGRTLVGVDEGSVNDKLKSAEVEFGEAEHTLTVDELPKHNHSVFSGYQNDGKGDFDAFSYHQMDKYTSQHQNGAMLREHAKGDVKFIGNTGNGKAHSNYQPSYTCYIWKRVS